MEELAALRRQAHERFLRTTGSQAKKPEPGASGSSASTMAASPTSDAAASDAPRKARSDDPEELVAIAEAGSSPMVLHALEVLTAPGQSVRGCQVDPARPCLQALQNVVGWTQGGYDTRPSEEVQRQKHFDRLQVLLHYRQPPPPPPGEPPRVAMYDYLCDTLFGLPMRPVDPAEPVPDVEDLEGNLVRPSWTEVDWDKFACSGAARPPPCFRPNRYPYQLPRRQLREGAHEFQQQTQHWILWYLHLPGEPIANPSDDEIDSDLRCELMTVVSAHGFEAFDYIWYRNPGMSVPEVFHVQVFWIVPSS